MNIALIGPYGAGKGTQALRMAPRFNLTHISTGDLFRDHIRNQTELGKLIQDYLDKGELVPDEVADATMEEWLRVFDRRKGLLFDGFPRTLRQAEFLEKLLFELERTLDAVVYLRISDEEVIKRLSERLTCRQCFMPFHKTHNPFANCPYDQCQGEHLFQREDDVQEILATRLKLFHQETEPLTVHYQENEKLLIVDAHRSIDQVYQNIAQIIQSRFGHLKKA